MHEGHSFMENNFLKIKLESKCFGIFYILDILRLKYFLIYLIFRIQLLEHVSFR